MQHRPNISKAWVQISILLSSDFITLVKFLTLLGLRIFASNTLGRWNYHLLCVLYNGLI